MRSRWRFDEASALKSRAVHPAWAGAGDSGVARFIAGRGIVACAEPEMGRVVGKAHGWRSTSTSWPQAARRRQYSTFAVSLTPGVPGNAPDPSRDNQRK